MIVARSDANDVGQTRHGRGVIPLRSRAVAQVAVVIAAPSPDRAVAAERNRMTAATGHRHDVAQARHQRGGVFVLIKSVVTS